MDINWPLMQVVPRGALMFLLWPCLFLTVSSELEFRDLNSNSNELEFKVIWDFCCSQTNAGAFPFLPLHMPSLNKSRHPFLLVFKLDSPVFVRSISSLKQPSHVLTQLNHLDAWSDFYSKQLVMRWRRDLKEKSPRV